MDNFSEKAPNSPAPNEGVETLKAELDNALEESLSEWNKKFTEKGQTSYDFYFETSAGLWRKALLPIDHPVVLLGDYNSRGVLQAAGVKINKVLENPDYQFLRPEFSIAYVATNFTERNIASLFPDLSEDERRRVIDFMIARTNGYLEDARFTIPPETLSSIIELIEKYPKEVYGYFRLLDDVGKNYHTSDGKNDLLGFRNGLLGFGFELNTAVKRRNPEKEAKGDRGLSDIIDSQFGSVEM